MVKDLGPYGYESDEGYARIMEPATSFLRRQGVPLAALPSIQQDWWFARHPDEVW